MRTRACLHLLLGLDVACALSMGTHARAQSSAPIAVSGSCPEEGALDRLLSTLLPALPPTAKHVAVSDLGDTYLVAVGDRAKTYADPNRDCAERARVAAAFIALVLAPEVPSPPTAPTAPPPPPPPRAPPPLAPAPTRWMRWDARGAGAIAPQSGIATPGAEVLFSAGSRTFGGQVACEWLAAMPMSVGDGTSILIERVPCALGPIARVFPIANRLEIGVEPALALGAVIATGRGFDSTLQTARFEVGARIAVDAAWHFGPRAGGLAPVVGLEATVYPVAYDLDVASRGTVAHTPNFWAGVTAGVCWTVE